MRKVSTQVILSAATTTGAGTAFEPVNLKRTFQATGFTSTGTGGASIQIQVSNDGVSFIRMGTITLALTTTVSTDGFTSDAPWRYVRANVITLTGTNASVTVIIGNETRG